MTSYVATESRIFVRGIDRPRSRICTWYVQRTSRSWTHRRRKSSGSSGVRRFVSLTWLRHLVLVTGIAPNVPAVGGGRRRRLRRRPRRGASAARRSANGRVRRRLSVGSFAVLTRRRLCDPYRTLHPVLPTLRIAAYMETGEDDNRIRLDYVEEAVRKLAKKSASYALVDRWVGFRVSLDRGKCNIGRPEKLVAESMRLFIVPVIGIVDIRFRHRAEVNGAGHRSSRRRSFTSAQDAPASFSSR